MSLDKDLEWVQEQIHSFQPAYAARVIADSLASYDRRLSFVEADRDNLAAALRAVVQSNDSVDGALGDIAAAAGPDAAAAAKRALEA